MKKIFLILLLLVLVMGLLAFFQSNVTEDISLDDNKIIDDIVDDSATKPSPVGILPFDSGIMDIR